MTKLTDTQLIVLSKASQRDDGAACVPERMPKSAALKLGESLIRGNLMRQVRSKPGMPIWRHDAEDRPISLVILNAGRAAIGVDDDGADARSGEKSPHASSSWARRNGAQATANPLAKLAARHRKQHGASDHSTGSMSIKSPGSSKRDLVIAMLTAASGATISELVTATGWLPHTTRAMLTGLRKSGFGIERRREEGSTGSTYRITQRPAQAA